jgi:hypothetical protein
VASRSCAAKHHAEKFRVMQVPIAPQSNSSFRHSTIHFSEGAPQAFWTKQPIRVGYELNTLNRLCQRAYSTSGIHEAESIPALQALFVCGVTNM